MIKRYDLSNPSQMKQWDDFVLSHPNGTPFHLSFWLKTIHDTFAYEPLLHVLKGNEGRLSGVFPCFKVKSFLTGSRIVSLPFSDYGGPILGNENQVNKLINFILNAFKKPLKYIEIRGSMPKETHFVSYNYFKRHFLFLGQNLDRIKSNFNKRTILYSVRKALNKGIQIKKENSPAGIEEFYRMYKLTRRKHGVPQQSKLFFDNLYRHVVLKRRAFILLALKGSKSIAASIFLVSDKTIHYKYNVSDPDYMKQFSPNHLLTFSAITDGYRNGYKYFDFGRTDQGNKGLMRYKEMWGAEAIDLPYSYYPKVKGVNSKEYSQVYYHILTHIWKSLPYIITKKLGPTILKHLA